MSRGSILITGGDQEKRRNKALKLAAAAMGAEGKRTADFKNLVDVFVEDKEELIGIENIRQLEKRLALKPLKLPGKIALIIEAERMSLAAQNAFLKTLEEPPGETTIILTTRNEKNLLPTMVSRCQVIRLAFEVESFSKIKELENTWQIMSQGTLGEKFALAESAAKEGRVEAKRWLSAMTFFLRTKMLESAKNNGQATSLAFAHEIKMLLKTQELIEKNVNVRLALENLLINYPEHGGSGFPSSP